ncbi:putative Fe-S cluster assembly protein SufT [Aequoribacter fuscus]|uniref:putative Fe-S cluster assembly protein SufT n=1 Tax=Aequoribacter fuscus TaxID=2518989 RepID=UPI00030E9FC5|nr:putative Fe-S cluster assembly protein SufT [Aequoribacter fuscus]QHJ88460.1 putative Fe-S cluster assembly protein SufT [Aequoribacter fuscus]
MSSQERTLLTTQREVLGRLVPVGTPVTVPAHSFVTLTQALGGNYTIVHAGNMVRIDGTDADALGLEPLDLKFEDPQDGSVVEAYVWEALGTVFDPEVPVDLVNLGLVYDVVIDQAQGSVAITMTLTAPGCGMGDVLVGDVRARVACVPNVKTVAVNLVFSPPWSREMMSEEAQLATGMFY